jgi:diguanylate cyclase (GGDEF)-like protein
VTHDPATAAATAAATAEPTPAHAPLAATATAEAERSLMRLALAQLPLGLSVFDPHDRLQLANARWAELWQVPPALAVPGSEFREIMAHCAGEETEASRHHGPLPLGRVGTRRREWRMADGRHIEVTVTRLADGTTVAVHEDISERRRQQAVIERLARTDPLTGLCNRAVLAQELSHHLRDNPAAERRHAAPAGDEIALLWLDLDRFKQINDTLGHPAGDEVLKQVAERLRRCVRDTDVIVRLGGDEFALLQRGQAQPAAAAALARRVIEVLAQPYALDGQLLHLGTSIGIAVAPYDGTTPEALLRCADLALYGAKAAGRGSFQFFEPGMGGAAQERLRLQADLSRALARQELQLCYQPQVHADTGEVLGAEALLRWQHPQRGAVSPAVFVPLAEQSGDILAIGRWVLAQACQDALQWPASVRVAVNVSAAQFRHGALLRDAAAALSASGLPPHRLELEVTESAMLHDADSALAQLSALRQRGVRVAMDDFGTGYSSLSQLRRFRVDRLKIDRSFVRDVDRDPTAAHIVRAVVALARDLGMDITAEGVETASQRQAVHHAGVRELQGFLYARPMPAAALRALMHSRLGPTETTE